MPCSPGGAASNAAGCYCDAAEPRTQMGTGSGNDSLRAGAKGTGAGYGANHEETSARHDPGAAPAGRRRDGHAVDARRTGAGQLRRGVESHASGARARHPAPLRARPARSASSPTRSADRASCSTATPTAAAPPNSTKREWRSRARALTARTGYVLGDIGPFGGLLGAVRRFH